MKSTPQDPNSNNNNGSIAAILAAAINQEPQAFDSLEGRHLETANAFLAVFQRMRSLQLGPTAYATFYNEEALERENLGLPEDFKVSPRRIEHALTKLAVRMDAADLADGRRKNGRTWEIPDWATAEILAMLVQEPHAKLRKIMAALEKVAVLRRQTPPNYHSVRRFVIRVKEGNIPALLRAANDGGTYKDHGGKMERNLQVSGLEAQLDSHWFDCQVPDENYNLVNPWLTAVVDAATHLTLGWVVTSTPPKMADQARAVRHALLQKGVDHAFGGWFPKIVTDNAREYRSEQFERMLARLGIEHKFIAKKQSPQNGSVERSFRDFEEIFGDGFPAYLRTRRALKGEKYTGTWKGFQKAVDEFFFHMAFRHIHSRLGKTRFEAWYSMLPADFPKVCTAKELDEVMFLGDKRTVHDGRVTLNYIHHTHPGLVGLNGKSIVVTETLDPDDKIYRAYHRENFIGILKPTRDIDLAKLVTDQNIAQTESASRIVNCLNKVGGRSRRHFNASASSVVKYSHIRSSLDEILKTVHPDHDGGLWI